MPDGAGKGDKPRNCFSRQFKDNYDLIVWRKPQPAKEKLKSNVKKNSSQVHSDK